jgi:hypothetical protein
MLTYAIVLVALACHATQAIVFPQAMNIRTTVAILAFASCAAFADRFSEDRRYAVPLLRLFGISGMTILTVALQLNIAPSA